MGACGCGDYNASHRLPGPDGITYTIELYRGCNYCGTPVSVVIYRHDANEAAIWSADTLPEAEFRAYSELDPINGEHVIPILGHEALREALATEITDAVAEAVRDSMKYEGYKLVNDAIDATIEKGTP